MRTARLAGLMVFAAVVAACTKKPPPAPAPTPAPIDSTAIKARMAADAAARAKARQDSIDAANRAKADADARARDAAARLEAARADARRKLEATVYFDLDKDEIRDDQKATLDAKVAILNMNPDIRIRIDGHTDDRGTDQYNLALGQRRAASVRRYLVARGLAEARFDVQSFGEQRPAVQGEDESAWSKNRRAEFSITAGGNPIKVQ